MTNPLRPMSISEILDSAFRLYRAHFVTFLGIVALVQLPVMVLQALLSAQLIERTTRMAAEFESGATGNPLADGTFVRFLVMIGALLLLSGFQALFVQSFVTGALSRAISRSYLGEPVSILDSYRFGIERYLSLIGALLLLALCYGAVIALVIGCPFGLLVAGQAAARESGDASGMATIVGSMILLLGGMLVYVVVALVFATRFVLLTQVVVLEGNGPLEGLRRSWSLVSGSFWRVLGMLMLVGLLSYFISLIPNLLVSTLLQLINGNGPEDLVFNQFVTTLAAQLGVMFALPLFFAIYTLLYYDLRVRKEGYDLQRLAEQAALT